MAAKDFIFEDDARAEAEGANMAEQIREQLATQSRLKFDFRDRFFLMIDSGTGPELWIGVVVTGNNRKRELLAQIRSTLRGVIQIVSPQITVGFLGRMQWAGPRTESKIFIYPALG